MTKEDLILKEIQDFREDRKGTVEKINVMHTDICLLKQVLYPNGSDGFIKETKDQLKSQDETIDKHKKYFFAGKILFSVFIIIIGYVFTIIF